MIVIVGESGSGKSSFCDTIVQRNPKFHKVVTYTTRPQRDNEVQDVDYHFVSRERFEKLIEEGFFIEHTVYNNWYYGTAKEDCEKEDGVAVLTPSGLRALERNEIYPISIYLCVDRRSRMIKALERGDDIEEAYRRSLSDVGQFDGVEDEVRIIFHNDNYQFSTNEMYDLLMEVLEQLESESAE